jgi:hypothetical protein
MDRCIYNYDINYKYIFYLFGILHTDHFNQIMMAWVHQYLLISEAQVMHNICDVV